MLFHTYAYTSDALYWGELDIKNLEAEDETESSFLACIRVSAQFTHELVNDASNARMAGSRADYLHKKHNGKNVLRTMKVVVVSVVVQCNVENTQASDTTRHGNHELFRFQYSRSRTDMLFLGLRIIKLIQLRAQHGTITIYAAKNNPAPIYTRLGCAEQAQPLCERKNRGRKRF